MNYPVSSIPLRAALTTLAASLSLLLMGGGAGASIRWSGEQDIVCHVGPGINTTLLDLDGDGTDDFSITNYEGTVTFLPLRGNAGVATSRLYDQTYWPLPYATPIRQVLPAPHFWMTQEDILASYIRCYWPGYRIDAGPWYGIGSRLLGISFKTGQDTHYGWIRMSRDILVGYVFHDWAYETQAGAPIKAGAKPVVVPMAAPEVARAGYVRLKWPSEVGKAYQVQTRTRMDALTWTNLIFLIPATATDTMVDVPMEGAAHFFRVVEAH